MLLDGSRKLLLIEAEVDEDYGDEYNNPDATIKHSEITSFTDIADLISAEEFATLIDTELKKHKVRGNSSILQAITSRGFVLKSDVEKFEKAEYLDAFITLRTEAAGWGNTYNGSVGMMNDSHIADLAREEAKLYVEVDPISMFSTEQLQKFKKLQKTHAIKKQAGQKAAKKKAQNKKKKEIEKAKKLLAKEGVL